MEESNSPYYVSNREKYYSYLSLFVFAVLMFFVMIGMKMPFGEKVRDAGELTTSNVFNQVVFASLFLFSIFLIIPKVKTFLDIIRNEKYFTLFLIWCLITIIWSDHAWVSTKRYIQYITVVTVCFAVLLNVKDFKQIITVFKILFGAYLFISFVTIFTIPGALDPFGIWRGVSPHKNILGQISLLSLIFFTLNIGKDSSLSLKAVNIFFVLIAFVLIVGSRSTTALLTFLILLGFASTLLIDKVFEPIGIRKTVSILIVIGFGIVFISIFMAAPDILNSIIGVGFGKDMTFTGRVNLWADILSEAKNHLLLGTGYQGYWVVDSPEMLELYEVYHWLPTQAHNGYIDIFNEVGIIGSVLFLFILINYYAKLPRANTVQIWKWFVLAAIIVNLTESQFIRPKAIVGVMFFFSYFTLFTDLLKQESQDYSDGPQRSNPFKSNSSINYSNI